MILYFSGTGNCRFVAQQLAQALSDVALSIEEAPLTLNLQEGESLGIVTPTHWWEVPAVFRSFLQNMTLNGKSVYTFAVATYGMLPGSIGGDVKHILAPKGIVLDAVFGVKMPDTWTPVFNLSNKSKVQKKLDAVDAQIENVASCIKARQKGNRTFPQMPYSMHIFTDAILNVVRKTKHFYVENDCVGCGRCAKHCPVHAIELQQGRPIWVQERCTLCLRCLHNCPNFAIQYDIGLSKKHGQYTHPCMKAEQEEDKQC